VAARRRAAAPVAAADAAADACEQAVGFIGLGIMGDGMVRRLLEHGGRRVVVWNRSPEKAATLKAEHADRVTVAESPKAVLEACSLTYVMLSTPDAVKSVYEMDGGILAGVAAGKQLVDCATLAPEDMARLSAQVVERGGRFLEAPVTGSKVPARDGQLVFLTAGDEALFHTAQRDLAAMGKASLFLGEAGAATRMKLCNNLVMSTMLAAYGEGLALAQAAGLDASKLIEVLGLGVCASPVLAAKAPKMAVGDHATNFPLKHAEKDMALALDLGAALGLELPVAAQVDTAMRTAMAMEGVEGVEGGMGDADFSAIYEAQKPRPKSK
jgi:3-hydroxyisobutyrate dehydrogenase-like beta-hydroxyacid dehydrogenase